MEMIFLLRYFFQAAFAFGMAISVFFTAPVLLEKKALIDADSGVEEHHKDVGKKSPKDDETAVNHDESEGDRVVA
jgi:hypothetical protein